MTRRLVPSLAALGLAALVSAPAAHASAFTDPNAPGFAPRVPLSAFARPASWFDPSRLHLMSTMSFGSGFDGRSSALSVTRLSYAFRVPVTLGVSVGNTFGTDGAGKGSPFFLEGLDLTWRPSANSLFRVEFHDARSALQLRGWGHRYGTRDPFLTPY
jgi:hypothetical protein